MARPQQLLPQTKRPAYFGDTSARTACAALCPGAPVTPPPGCAPDQCKNDKDGTVESDERLRITGVPSGSYDVKLTDVTARLCIVRGIKIEAGAIFSIDEKDLTSCER